MKKISIGMVGVGSFGQQFVELFKYHPFVSRIALCDIHKDRLAECAKKFNITETYDSLDAICKSDIEALVIITQHWLHAPQAIQAMKAGKHVYSAVPIISLGDGDEMLDWVDKLINTCKSTGMKFMMGETSHYQPQPIYCRRRQAEGAFGHIVYAEGEYFHDVDLPACSLRDVFKNRWGAQWDMSKSGGVPMHYPTHSIGSVLSVIPAHATHVSAFGQAIPNDDWFRKDAEGGNVFGNETALFRLSNGATMRICEFRRIGYYGFESGRIFGTKASFFENDDRGGRWVTAGNGWSLVKKEEMVEPFPEEVVAGWNQISAEHAKGIYGGHGGSHPYLVHEFVDSLVKDRQPAINAWVAARYFVPGIFAHKSALRDGELMKIPDFGNPPA